MAQFIQKLSNLKKIILFLFICCAYTALSASKSFKNIEIRSEKLSLNYGNNVAEYYGNVKVNYDGTVIYCDKAKIFYSSKEKKSGSDKSISQKKSLLDVIKFYGNVMIESENNKAYSNYGVFTKSNNLVVLEQNVKLKEKKGYVTGSKLVYNIQTKKMNLRNDSGNKRVSAVINE